MSTNLKIAIAEPSVIIRSGLENLLKRLPGFRIQMVEIHSVESLFDSLRMHKPDVLIVNPALPGYFTLQHLKEESGCAEMKCIALLYSVSDSVLLRSYDEQINIYDSADEIKHKLERIVCFFLRIRSSPTVVISLGNFKFIVPAVLRSMRLSISWSN